MQFSFDQTEADGQVHHYEGTCHGADGEVIMWRLYELGAAPAAQALDSLMKGGEEIAKIIVDLQSDEKRASMDPLDLVVKVLGKVDMSGVGPALSKMFAGMDPKLTASIFQHTKRDGEFLMNPAVRSKAFQGNWFAMNKALVEVIKQNHFLPLPGM